MEKIGRLLPSSEKDKLFELRIPEGLQQAARHRIIQVQLAASKALKAWKDEMDEDSSLERAKGLSVHFFIYSLLKKSEIVRRSRDQ